MLHLDLVTGALITFDSFVLLICRTGGALSFVASDTKATSAQLQLLIIPVAYRHMIQYQ